MKPRIPRPGRIGIRLAGLAVVAAIVAAGCAFSTGGAIGIQSIRVTPDFRVPDSPSEAALFVETGSVSEHCLATLQESQAMMPVRELFCAHRTATFDGGATHLEGIWLHLFFPADPGDRLDVWVNLYQEGAKSYALPRYCFTEHGC